MPKAPRLLRLAYFVYIVAKSRQKIGTQKAIRAFIPPVLQKQEHSWQKPRKKVLRKKFPQK